MAEPSNAELEEELRASLRDLENPLLDKGRSRARLLRGCADFLEHSKTYAWDEEQRSRVRRGIQGLIRYEATISLADHPDFTVELLYIGVDNAFVKYPGDGYEDCVFLSCINPTTIREIA